MDYPRALTQLVRELKRLPGIGPRAAQRLAFFIVAQPRQAAQALQSSLADSLEQLTVCKSCFGICEGELCEICADTRRDEHLVCVVEEAADIYTIERTGAFVGRYHVVGGAISPLDGVGPEDLRIEQLLERVRRDAVDEIILAFDLDAEGESTANHIAERAGSTGVRVSRLGLGLPSGARIEFSDPQTLKGAFASRRKIS